MLDIIKFLNLGEWTTIVLAILALWHWLLKGLVEKWFQNKLDIQKQEVASALQIQKDLFQQKAEFEKIKLDRVLPLFEELNSVITEHRMMFNSYLSWVKNKGGLPDGFDNERLKLDEKFIPLLSSIAIYLPTEFRTLVYQFRKVISCSWKAPNQTYYYLFEEAGIKSVYGVTKASQEIYSNFVNCFYDMCNKYLGLSPSTETYSEILERYNFDEFAHVIDPTPDQAFSWSYLILHEYSGSNAVEDAMDNLVKKYKHE